MEDESDEELEELNELIEGSQNASSPASSSSPSSSPPHPPPPPSSEIEIEFRNRRETDTANIHDFTGLPNGVKQSAAPNMSPESTPFTIFFLFFRQIFAILLTETN